VNNLWEIAVLFFCVFFWLWVTGNFILSRTLQTIQYKIFLYRGIKREGFAYSYIVCESRIKLTNSTSCLVLFSVEWFFLFMTLTPFLLLFFSHTFSSKKTCMIFWLTIVSPMISKDYLLPFLFSVHDSTWHRGDQQCVFVTEWINQYFKNSWNTIRQIKSVLSR